MTREEKIAMCKAYYDALCDGAAHSLLATLTDDPAPTAPGDPRALALADLIVDGWGSFFAPAIAGGNAWLAYGAAECARLREANAFNGAQAQKHYERAEAAQAAQDALSGRVHSLGSSVLRLKARLAAAQRGPVVEVVDRGYSDILRIDGVEMMMVSHEQGLAIRAAIGSPAPVREHLVEVRHEGVWWTVHLNGTCLVPMSAISEQTAERAAQEIRAALNAPAAKDESDDELAERLYRDGVNDMRTNQNARLDADGTAKPKSTIDPSNTAEVAPVEYRNGDGAKAALADRQAKCFEMAACIGEVPQVLASARPYKPNPTRTTSDETLHTAVMPGAHGAPKPAPARGYLLQLGDKFVCRCWRAESEDRVRHDEPFATREEAKKYRALCGADGGLRRARIVRADPPKYWVVKRGKELSDRYLNNVWPTEWVPSLVDAKAYSSEQETEADVKAAGEGTARGVYAKGKP